MHSEDPIRQSNASRRETRTSLQARIALLAARRMVVDGEDPERAKLKAAEALGAGAGPGARAQLPDNEQLRAALRAYLRSNGGEVHRAWLHARRQLALRWMQRLARFRPYLVGAVLDGSATSAECLELELFTDSAKDVEMALLELGIDFRVEAADRPQARVQQLIGFVDTGAQSGAAARRDALRGVPVLLRVRDPVALRVAPVVPPGQADPGMHLIERSGRADERMLRRLLSETAGPGHEAVGAAAEDGP
jgi:hypothetical protein